MNALAELFLRTLFGDEGVEGHWFHLWRLGPGDLKTTYWYPVPSQVNYGRIGDDDVYVGVSLAAQQGTESDRIKADQSSAIVALWADVDWADDVHKKSPTLPKTQQSALDLIGLFPLQPSLIVNSGHGYQCWWLLKEPWIFESAHEREDAAEFCRRWMGGLRNVAGSLGFSLDGVHDLSRVMRLPGTFNNKNPEEPRAVFVEIQPEQELRYNPSDFEPYLSDLVPRPDLPPISLGGLPIDIGVPMEKMEVLKANNPTFRNLWMRKRAPANDVSASGYDLALANIAVVSGWTDAEVYGLLLANRRKWGDNMKYQGYYERTISKARADAEAEKTLREEASPDSRPGILRSISQTLGVEVLDVEEFMGDPPQYRVTVLGGRGIWIGSSENFVNQNAFRTRILGGSGHLSPRMKEEKWATVVNAMMRVRTKRSMGMEQTESGRIEEWIRAYLTSSVPVMEPLQRVTIHRRPFIFEGAIYVYSNTFKSWIQENLGEKVNSAEFAAQMENFGAYSETIFYINERTQKRTSTSVRKLPSDLFHVDDYAREGTIS